MESTWEWRDLLVLDAIVRYFDEQDGPEIPDVETFVKLTGMDPGQVARAVRALSPRFIKTGAALGGLMDAAIMGVTDEARQAVGQWPSPEVWVERLVQALRKAAEHEPDLERKRRLRALAEGLGGFARDVAVGVLSAGITQNMGSSERADGLGAGGSDRDRRGRGDRWRFVGAWWQARGQQRIERDRRRDRAAEVAAAAIELLQDLDPYRAVEIERSRYKAEVKALTRRRLDVRGQLWVLAAGHPSKDVRAHTIDAAQELGDCLTASSGLVQSMHETLDEDAVTDARELAIQYHRTAR